MEKHQSVLHRAATAIGSVGDATGTILIAEQGGNPPLQGWEEADTSG
ncbi:hypothetical protein RYH80_17860 [Halobaculum sp. MBLA0147]